METGQCYAVTVRFIYPTCCECEWLSLFSVALRWIGCTPPLTHVSWDRLQHPSDPAWDKAVENGWMDEWRDGWMDRWGAPDRLPFSENP